MEAEEAHLVSPTPKAPVQAPSSAHTVAPTTVVGPKDPPSSGGPHSLSHDPLALGSPVDGQPPTPLVDRGTTESLVLLQPQVVPSVAVNVPAVHLLLSLPKVKTVLKPRPYRLWQWPMPRAPTVPEQSPPP